MSTQAWRRGLPYLLAALALLVGAGCVGADGATESVGSRISVSDPYIPDPPGDVAAAYLHISNDGDGGDTLLGVRSDASRVAELHETVFEGGSVSMRRVDALAIPAGETVALEPGGFHVMLIDPVAPLEEGGQVRLVLTFEAAGEVEVLADVVHTGGPR